MPTTLSRGIHSFGSDKEVRSGDPVSMSSADNESQGPYKPHASQAEICRKRRGVDLANLRQKTLSRREEDRR